MQPNDEMVKAITIEGEVLHISPKRIVGICHSPTHPGVLTKKLLEGHDCIGKACPRLEKNENSTYWYTLENAQRHKAKLKTKKLRQKAAEISQEDSAREITKLLQDYIDDIGYDMEIVRVEKLKKDWHKIFYVSGNSFADGNQFPELFAKVKERHPSWQLTLRHIKGMDGHFVTRDEFHLVKR